MKKLVFDIETVGERFEDYDQTSQNMLTRWIRETSDTDEKYQIELKRIKDQLGLSPLTGFIVAIGIMDAETGKGAVLYQAPKKRTAKTTTVGDITFMPMTEAEMLEAFWRKAENYTEFISFNGRQFDAPYLMVRSALHKVRPTKDLLSNRYISSQRDSAKHIDLQDQLSFYGALVKKGSLHMWCRLFGITSPKAGGVDGHDVANLFNKKKYLDIARYNVGDLVATRELYWRWSEYMRM